MKKSFTTFCLLLCTLSFLNNNLYAQRTAGGYAAGITPAEPCPTHFTRNNGNGTCAGLYEIRVYFTQAPSVAPSLEAIYYQGQALYGTAMNVAADLADLTTKGYLSYCMSYNNLPPAVKLTIVFHYANTGQADCVVAGTQ